MLDFQNKLQTFFSENGKPCVYNKGAFIIREGEIEHYLYFIESGAVRVIYLNELEEQTIRFGYKGSYINSLSSFISGKPSEFYIQAIRKTLLYKISRLQIQELVSADMESQKGYIELLENLITQQIEREVDLMINSPNDRLTRVLQRSPTLFQEIPLKYIASYLRMTPETLSRIRNS